jgi:hypothetical protein
MLVFLICDRVFGIGTESIYVVSEFRWRGETGQLMHSE